MRAAATTLLAELVDPDGRLDPERWAVAHRDQEQVAVCGCGGRVLPAAGPEVVAHFGVRWYSMCCAACGHETEVTGTRVLPTMRRRPSLVLTAVATEVEARKLGDG